MHPRLTDEQVDRVCDVIAELLPARQAAPMGPTVVTQRGTR
jgi:hypothetical protein